jgi:hypothetical protein
VVVSPSIYETLAGEDDLNFKGIRTRFLKGIGRVHLHVVRRAADVDEGPIERAWRQRGVLRDRVADLLERRTEGGSEPAAE